MLPVNVCWHQGSHLSRKRSPRTGKALSTAWLASSPKMPLPADVEVSMRGGGAFRWAKGEWTDDTSMAIAIAEVAARGLDLRTEEAQDAIVARWYEWSRTAPDVGNQTRHVLGEAGRDPRGATAASAREASTYLHDDTGHTAGNGSLMRAAAVALAYLDDEDGLIEASQAIGVLTHFDPEAGEACLIWCLAIRHAVLTGELDVRIGLRHLDPARATVWVERFIYAEHHSPADFTHNGWVVEALQGAWSAIARTPVPDNRPTERTYRADHLRRALEATVRGGRDADTVAAIAGGLLGAAYGASAVPAAWRRILHGWPGLRSRDLVVLANAIVDGGRPDRFDYSYVGYGDLGALVQHPHDDQIWLGAVGALAALPAGVDAVVSLVSDRGCSGRRGGRRGSSHRQGGSGRESQPRVRARRRGDGDRGVSRAGSVGARPLRPGPQPHPHDRGALRRSGARNRTRRGAARGVCGVAGGPSDPDVPRSRARGGCR
jgi:ADP-ribosylglycohydrolase